MVRICGYQGGAGLGIPYWDLWTDNVNNIQESTMEPPALDAEGFAICPDCGSLVNCGMIGLPNLEKRHCGTKVCKTAQQKRDKDVKRKKNRMILSFLRPKAAIVLLTIDGPPPVHSYKLVLQTASPTAASTTTEHGKAVSNSMSKSVLGPISNSFIKEFQDLVKNLPASVPEASEFERLAVFGGNLKEFDDTSLEADELWEESLNGVLKSMLDWGTEGNMDEIICCERWGLDSLVDFATYFVEECGTCA
ncbi:uncharacterized protein LACBIDRAFT_324844 [Laccaria bicolor S238N-H82]|uniref:Predicted protein n=1 Tax=Laccaria bicolor (strain S238N-H82 / ATCC MYA-4686) TaxID=486041 RepID=B0D383_LACBS|nr:uncharacterized protein LACBIDRAFT_324844 [Laccaria bicolor S238N-H82]EDR11237.1 predicted protein [Laccaria bicolor S238N-H82]|eukprot:XP_001878538.1 predicted protein [Laccaria bicolor S238N-H82]